MIDKDKITELVDNYIESMHTSDSNLVRDIFHSDAMITGHINGNLLRQTKEDWVKFVGNLKPSPAEKNEDKSFELLLLDIASETAVAKIKSRYINREFLDTLSLLRVGEKWVIYNKIFETT